MRIEWAHEFEKAEAKRRLMKLCDYWENKYGIEPRWREFEATVSGSILGFTFKADVEVQDDLVVVEGPEPSLLIRRRVIAYIERKLAEYLSPS